MKIHVRVACGKGAGELRDWEAEDGGGAKSEPYAGWISCIVPNSNQLVALGLSIKINIFSMATSNIGLLIIRGAFVQPMALNSLGHRMHRDPRYISSANAYKEEGVLTYNNVFYCWPDGPDVSVSGQAQPCLKSRNEMTEVVHEWHALGKNYDIILSI